jgi:hypothetical protein
MGWQKQKIACKLGVAAIGVALAFLSTTACGNRSDLALATATAGADATGNEDAGEALPGELDVHLVEPPGIRFNGVGFSIANPAIGFTDSGGFPLPGPPDFSVKGLPPAKGYEIVLSAPGPDGNGCMGQIAFDVMPGATTTLDVMLACSGGPLVTGGIDLDASTTGTAPPALLAFDASPVGFVPCPTILSLSANPTEILPPQIAQLDIAYEPAVATVTWLAEPATPSPKGEPAPTGRFLASPGHAAQFACGGACCGGFCPGVVTITATVALPAGYACAGALSTSMSLDVDCFRSGSCMTPTGSVDVPISLDGSR